MAISFRMTFNPSARELSTISFGLDDATPFQRFADVSCSSHQEKNEKHLSQGTGRTTHPAPHTYLCEEMQELVSARGKGQSAASRTNRTLKPRVSGG